MESPIPKADTIEPAKQATRIPYLLTIPPTMGPAKHKIIALCHQKYICLTPIKNKAVYACLNGVLKF